MRDVSEQAMDNLAYHEGKIGETEKAEFNININIRDFSQKDKEEDK